MASLPLDVRASYIVIIDDILSKSDLNTISSKRIREGLQQAVDYDITPQKDAIKTLIMERFDKFAADAKDISTTNGHTDPPEPAPTRAPEPPKSPPTPKPKTIHKRKSPSYENGAGSSEELSDAPSTPPKKKRKSAVEDDAAFAARLQAEENNRARPTRGGNSRKPPAAKKKKQKSPKKKTSAKVGADDDSEMSGSEAERKVNRSGGFHKPLTLSAPLSALLDGETQLSRPQTVKRIWEYVKARDLQDPKDKRQIRCDDALRAVFKQDKVHMFTMNKILATQMYDPDA